MDFAGGIWYIFIMTNYDVIIIGAGAAGLSAARAALARGRSVAVLDMGAAPARKVAVSGGGRCNFTNMAAGRDRYFGCNPDFVRGALARVSPTDILDWARDHKIKFVEKSAGQYFCATGAADIVRALTHDASAANIILNSPVDSVAKNECGFLVCTERDQYKCKSIIIASGGTSFATLGVSDVGQQIAKQFGHKIIPMRPALCAIATKVFSPDLAGIAMPVEIHVAGETICDDMLFTHFGVGGPAIYRATVRDINAGLKINLVPKIDMRQALRDAKRTMGRKSLGTVLSTYMPVRVAKWIAGDATTNIADYKDNQIAEIATRICQIEIRSADMRLHNLASAEIVRGGVDTTQISSKTMESKLCPGLFWAGEVMDISGDLGGFNLHWAWASGTVAGQNA